MPDDAIGPRRRGSSSFRQRDVSRAILAAKAAGEDVVRIEVEPGGKIIIITARDSDKGQGVNSWDRVLG